MGKARDLANLLLNGLVPPTKLSEGAPTWNAAGSVGIKATPNAGWPSDYAVLQVNATGSLNGNAVAVVLSNNVYFDGTSFRFLTAAPVSDYFQYNGVHTWRYGVSGTAGAVATMVLGMTLNASGNLGVGTDVPTERLDVRDGKIRVGGAINGKLLGYNVSNTLVFDFGAGSVTGVSTDVGLVNLASGSVVLGTNGVERARIDVNGGFILAGSTAQKATGTTWSNPSDQRLKDNIRDYEKGIAKLMQVRVREWEYNGKGGTVEGAKGLGVVADEVMIVLPDTVDSYQAKLNADDEETTTIKKFDATEITWLLVKAVQEQQAVIEQLKARLDAANL